MRRSLEKISGSLLYIILLLKCLLTMNKSLIISLTLFRISRTAFSFLVDLLRADLEGDTNNVGRKPLPVAKQICLALWYLATPDSYRLST